MSKEPTAAHARNEAGDCIVCTTRTLTEDATWIR